MDSLPIEPAGSLAHRAEPEVRVSDKWIRFSAPNDASVNKEASDLKVQSTFGINPML
jgi:hypothetical protein